MCAASSASDDKENYQAGRQAVDQASSNNNHNPCKAYSMKRNRAAWPFILEQE
jgi:hypothetical protein